MQNESHGAREILTKARRNRDPALVEVAVRQFQQLDDLAGVAECYKTLGEMRFKAGSYKESAAFYQQSLELYKECGSKKEEAHCFFSLSRCAAFLEKEPDSDTEMSHLTESLLLAEEIADQELQVQCYLRLAACLRDKEPGAAGNYYQKALHLLETMEKGWLSAICHQSLGHLYARKSENIKARKHYLASLEDLENARSEQQPGVDLRQAQCFESLGDLALREDDEEEAQAQYQQALAILEGSAPAGARRVKEKLEQLQCLE